MSEGKVVSGRVVPMWPKDALRIAFGIIWLIDAVLKWLPGFRAGYMSSIMGIRDGQPGWLKPWFTFWINLQHPDAAFFAYLVAVVETLIAVALIAGLARKYTYIAAAVFSVLIWATAEGFGGRLLCHRSRPAGWNAWWGPKGPCLPAEGPYPPGV